jgi:hypothetical protein
MLLGERRFFYWSAFSNSSILVRKALKVGKTFQASCNRKGYFAMPDIVELVKASSLVFAGTVQEQGASTVPSLKARDNFLVVRVDRGLRVDPVLGDLGGTKVTVAMLATDQLRPGDKAVFFTMSWIHGEGLAVQEVAHLGVQTEDEVAAAVARLPELHLEDRLRQAELVFVAEVGTVRPLSGVAVERDAPLWAVAELNVTQVLKGNLKGDAALLFPTSLARPWYKAPRFKEGQRGTFILQREGIDEDAVAAAGKQVSAPGFTALDPADFQPPDKLPLVQNLLAALEAKGGLK